MTSLDESYILELGTNCIKFDPANKNHAVFYDECNGQIFIVKNRGVDGVEVKGPDPESHMSFRLEEKGDVISIKFSPNFSILAVQRSQNTVEFINFTNRVASAEYLQSSKGRNSKILGFVWTNVNEIVFICDGAIDFFQIIPERKTVKHLKSHSVSVNWYVFQPCSAILLVSTGLIGNSLQVFQFRASSMYRLQKFEIDWTNKPKQSKLSLFERDVALVSLYGKTCLLVLHHETSVNSTGAQIHVYTLFKDGQHRKEHVLELQLTGKFAMNVVDDLIVVHHQTSQTSLLFDIRFPGCRVEDKISYHSPIVPPYSIKPFKAPGYSTCELYSTNWVVFQPNVIIDAKLGYLWSLQLNLVPLCRMMSNDSKLFDFLLLRKNSKQVILNICRDTICRRDYDSSTNILGKISFLFKKLNTIYKEAITESRIDDNKNCFEVGKKTCVVDQTDMFSETFCIFEQPREDMPDSYVVSVLFEYIVSLVNLQIPVEYFIYELLINVLVRSNQFYQLQQFLQYHVFTDSKPLACLLLSLQPKYPFAIQLALDMFKRLLIAQEDIVDIFLSQYEVIRALRYVQRHGNVDSISARKFLEFAMNSGDSDLFYYVFKFFEDRNLRLRGSSNFVRGEHCEAFVQHFQKLFGDKPKVDG